MDLKPLHFAVFLAIIAIARSCNGNCTSCTGCGGCATICQPAQCNACVQQCQTMQCQQSCVQRASCEKQVVVQEHTPQASNVANSQSSHSENAVDNTFNLNLTNVVSNENHINTPVNVDVQNVNNVRIEAASARTVERVTEIIRIEQSTPTPCKVQACEDTTCAPKKCETNCETTQCSDRVVQVPQPYPVMVPVRVPVPQPYPIRVPVQVPAPQQCCTVVQPCVHQGCQSYSQECGSHCSSSMVYRAVNPCQNNNCYKRESFNRYSCDQRSCGFVRQDCSSCSADNFYKSYDNYASCNGCFSSGTYSYGANYGQGQMYK